MSGDKNCPLTRQQEANYLKHIFPAQETIETAKIKQPNLFAMRLMNIHIWGFNQSQ